MIKFAFVVDPSLKTSIRQEGYPYTTFFDNWERGHNSASLVCTLYLFLRVVRQVTSRPSGRCTDCLDPTAAKRNRVRKGDIYLCVGVIAYPALRNLCLFRRGDRRIVDRP